jgi:acyl-coenzyme A thioesterase 9
MDLDALSGVIAYRHTGDFVTTVTAAFDRITINHPLTEICDLELSGMVTYATGRSSMEISLQVAKAPKDGEEVKPEDIMITCQCTMVSLDPGTKKPVNIAAVRTDTEEEKRLFKQGQTNSKRRKELAQRSLLKQTPDDEESDLIHSIWKRQLQYHDPNDPLRKPDNVYFMDATRLNTAQIMQPQYRNRYVLVTVELLEQQLNGFQTQLHDLRRLPPQANLRTRLLLRCQLLAHQTDLRLFGPKHLPEPSPSRQRLIPQRHSRVHGPAY